MLEETEEWPSSEAAGNDGTQAEMAKVAPHESNSESDEKPVKEPPKQHEPEAKPEKKPSKLKELWAKAGLDLMTIQMMFKGSLPPTIAIAMYQSHLVSHKFTTIGYLVAISSILGFTIMPRGKFIQTMTFNIISVCLAAAVNLLALYCGVKARQHTTPPGPPSKVVPYNSSASAVLAIWLCVQVYLINYARASRPQFQFPGILCSIFCIVSLTNGVRFPTMTVAISFMENLLEAFLTGFALATAVHFVVFPLSSRKVVFKEMTGYLMLLGGLLKAQTGYMASLETIDPDAMRKEEAKAAAEAEHNGHKSKKNKKEDKFKSRFALATPAGKAMKEVQGKLMELHTKLHGDITPAKREFAIGKLESHDLTELWRHMSIIFLPVVGLSSMINILERVGEINGWNDPNRILTEEEDEARQRALDNLHFLMKNLHQPFAQMTGHIGAAFQHVLLTLELIKPPKKKKQPDEESKGGEPAKPGTPGFAEEFKKNIDDFYASKQKTLRQWCGTHGIDLPDDYFENSYQPGLEPSPEVETARSRHQRQLFFTLYLEYLLWRVGMNVLDLVLYVDKRKQAGVLNKTKLIFPGSKTLYKWVRAAVGQEDTSEEDSFTTDMDLSSAQTVYLGKAFEQRRDPEHLPAQNALEKFGNGVRKIPKFLRADESAFGFRVVAATMSICIICYLEASQVWFLEQRLLWAAIMVAISMTRTNGQSMFNFVLRVLGTAVAMVGAYIVWYIVDGKTAGVIVFLWFWMFCGFWVVLKMPKFVIVGILSIVTSILIVGYELQVRVLGKKVATSNHQPAYPLYILAPYRLATVAGGIFVAFIWTIFPFPISESTELRKDLSAAIYLLCVFFETVHETIKTRISDFGGDPGSKGSHAYNLQKARARIFSKLVVLMQSLQTNSAFSVFQFRVGGRFPHETYTE